MTQSRLVRLGLFALAGLIIAGGVFAYRHFLNQNPEGLIESGEEAYAEGVRALENKDAAAAERKLHEAVLQANKAIDKLQKGVSESSQEAVERLAGQAHWLKARALRARAAAKVLAEKGELPEQSLDTTTGEKFFNVWAMADAEARDEAAGSLREAALRLPDDANVQKEAIRLELMATEQNAVNLERVCNNILELDPKDSRAHYQLARVHFTRAGERPDHRRQRTVLTAREHIEKSKRGDNYPLWRTLHLEARITRWVRDAQKDPVRRREEDQALRRLLLDEEGGALALAAADKDLAKRDVFEIEGALGLYQMALEEVRGAGGENGREAGMKVFADLLDLCRAASHDAAPAARAELIARAAVGAALLVQPIRKDRTPPGWKDRFDTVMALAEKARDQKARGLALHDGAVKLLERAARIAGKRGDKARQEKLNEQVMRWLEEGIRAGTEAKSTSGEYLTLHAKAAERKLLRGADREEYAAHLKVLKASKATSAQAVAELIEGVAAERAGRLDKARQHLEKALDLADVNSLKAHVVLANVYLATGQPRKALRNLGAVEREYRNFDALPERQKEWIREFLRGPEEVAYYLIVANLAAARKELAEATRDGGTVSADRARQLHKAVKDYEEAARSHLEELPPVSRRGLSARSELVEHYLRTGQLDEARKALPAAQQLYPESVALLRLEVALVVRPAGPKEKVSLSPNSERVKKADRRIRQFLADYPRDQSARLYWTQWLTRTERAGEAVAYLEDPKNFPGGRDARYVRVLAAALISKGQREEGARLLRELPHDAGIDLALIQLAATRDEQRKQVETALGRYEKNVLFRLLEARLDHADGKFGEAARKYFRSREFTRVRSAAREGLLRSLMALAGQDPRQAKTLIDEMLQEAPDESNLYVAYAYACLLLDETGEPGDQWQRTRNMVSALDAWEPLARPDGVSRAGALVTRAEFWSLANRPDLARDEVLRALSLDPGHAGALTLAVRLAAHGDDPGFLAKGQGYLDKLKKLKPDEAEPLLLQAQLSERLGNLPVAAAACEAVLAKDKRNPEANAWLAGLFLKQGDRAKAREQVRRWRENDPDSAAAALEGVRLFAEAGELDKARQAGQALEDDQARQATQRLDAQKPAEGLDAAKWTEIKRQQVDAIRLNVRLAVAGALARGKALDAAAEIAEQALKERGTFERAEFLLAAIAVQREDWPKARELFEKVWKVNPAHGVAGNNLAMILADKLDDAKAAYKVVKEVRKGRFSKKPVPIERLRADFIDTLGVIYQRMGDPSLYPEMREIFEAARRRYPADPRMYLFLGHACAGLKETGRARDLYKTAIELAAPEARNRLTPEQRQEVIKEAEAARENLRASAEP